METKEKTALIVGGLTLGGGLIYLMTRKAKGKAGVVEVSLENPPAGATEWNIAVMDSIITDAILQYPTEPVPEGIRLDWGVGVRDNIAHVAAFDIPGAWTFPLRIEIGIRQYIPGGSLELYRVQSWMPYLWDFDAMDWGSEPDPTYKEIFIPAPGSYIFDVAMAEFR